MLCLVSEFDVVQGRGKSGKMCIRPTHNLFQVELWEMEREFPFPKLLDCEHMSPVLTDSSNNVKHSFENSFHKPNKEKHIFTFKLIHIGTKIH